MPAGVVVLAKMGGTTVAEGMITGAVVRGTLIVVEGAAVVATSAADEDGTATGVTLVATTTGVALLLMTGLVTVQGQSVMVRVVACRKRAR